MRASVGGDRSRDGSIQVGSAAVSVTILPARGGKIASLLDKQSGREWLVQPARPLLEPLRYGSSFVAGDMCGWDEMLPTIIACRYPSADRIRRVHLPDHGELWACEWHVLERTSDSVLMAVEGRVLAYRLVRRITVTDATMRLDYRLTTAEPLWLLWAAHPQFVCMRDTRIALPQQVHELLDVTVPDNPVQCSWPADSPDHPNALPRGEGRKLYVAPDTSVDWAALVDNDYCWLRLSWDVRRVPYLGVWLDNHAYAGEPVVALEPSTGYYDDLERAHRMGKVPLIDPAGEFRWSIEATVASGSRWSACGASPNASVMEAE